MSRLLEVRNLKTHFHTRWGVLKAVDGVSFSLDRGETLGIVGESGSGKSVTAMSIVRVIPKPAGRIVDGEVLFDGENLLEKSEEEMRQIRGVKIGTILQDPMGSLNPIFTIGDQVGEAPKYHFNVTGAALKEEVLGLLRKVRIPSPEVRVGNWPHQLSGGMRQRVVGSIAISCSPSLLIADEPTTALDATIQLQYLQLLRDIQRDTGMALIFITHDFGVVARMCHRAAVMYAGRIVEMAPVRELFDAPRHPYTQGLLRSLPKIEEKVDRLPSIEGQPPQLNNLPPGCPFAPRCTKATEKCREEYPPETRFSDDHHAACWHV